LRAEIEAVQDGLLKPDGEAINSLHEEVLLLSRLVGDLHQLALSVAMALPLVRAQVPAASLVTDAAEQLRARLASVGVDLHVSVESGLPVVLVDHQRTGQAVANLLFNALRDEIFWSNGEPITADDFAGTVNWIYYDEAVASAGSTRNSLRNAGGDSIWTVIDQRTFPVERIVLAPNPYYCEIDEAGTPLPYLDEVVIDIVRGADYGVLVTELSNVGPATSTSFIAFNQNPIDGDDDAGISEPELSRLSNKRFRTAMTHLIDRKTCIKSFAFGFGYPQYSFVPTFSPYYQEGAEDAAPRFDPDAAEALRSLRTPWILTLSLGSLFQATTGT